MKKYPINRVGTKIKTIILSLWLAPVFFGLAHFPRLVLATGDTPFGKIEPPAGVKIYQDKVGTEQFGSGQIGIILFFSNVIGLLTIAAGVWSMLNFVFAGWTYITSQGDSSAGEKVSTKMTNTVIGLIIIALSYTIAAIIGLLIFGDAGYIISPAFRSVLTPAT